MIQLTSGCLSLLFRFMCCNFQFSLGNENALLEAIERNKVWLFVSGTQTLGNIFIEACDGELDIVLSHEELRGGDKSWWVWHDPCTETFTTLLKTLKQQGQEVVFI